MSASDDTLDRILREIRRDPTARHRSEIGYKKTHWGGPHRERSRKHLQKAYWGQHRGAHARGEIESQVADMDPAAGTFLSTDTIADLVPMGEDAWDALDLEEFLQDPVTGQSHRISRQTLYLSQLAREIVHGDSDMSSDDIEKLANLSPEFDSSLQDAYDDSYGVGRFRDDYGDDTPARLAERRRGPRGSDTRIAEKFGSADVREYFRQGTLDRHDTAGERELITSRLRRELLSEATIDYGEEKEKVEPETVDEVANVLITGIKAVFSWEPAYTDEEDEYRDQLKWVLATYPKAANYINDVMQDIRLKGGFPEYDESGDLSSDDYYNALEGDEWRED